MNKLSKTTPAKTDILPVLQHQLAPAIKRADDMLAIATPAQLEEASEALSMLNQYRDRLIDEKEKVTKPLAQALKAERARWAPIETRLDAAIQALRAGMSAYQTQTKRASDAAAERIAARVGEGRGKLKAETAVAKLAQLETPLKNVATESGSVQFRTMKKLVVDDERELIVSLLSYDSTLVSYSESGALRLLKEGNTDIKGAHIEEEQVPYNSR